MSPSGPPAILRSLLFLFPADHRRTYGDEMWEVVRHRFEGLRGAARALMVLSTAADLVRNALGMRAARMAGAARGAASGWALDARFVLRSLRRSPGYALTAVVVVAGAVAVNAAVFSFVRGTLLRAPSYPGADRAVVAWGSNPAEGQLRDVVSGPNYLDLRRRTATLDALAAWHAGNAAWIEDGRPVVVDALEATPDLWDVVPVRPAHGRLFTEADRRSGGEAVVVLSWDFFQERLGGDPAAVGARLPFVDGPRTVVGVLPEGFELLTNAPVWVPLHDDVLAADGRSRIHYHMLGRLQPGATPGDATRELSRILSEIAAEHPSVEGWSILAEPLDETTVLAVRPVLRVVAAAVALVLLVALVNLATLFRIRAVARSEELGVRLALGAGRGRLVRILGLEVGALATAGALAGLVAAPALVARIREMVPLWIPIPESAASTPALRATLDPGVVGGVGAAAVVGALALSLPALITALRARRPGGRRLAGARGTRGLVVTELALATVLLVGAGLTTRSAEGLLATDVGVQDEGLLALWVGTVWERPVEEQVAYFEEIVRAVEALPAVRSAALIDYLPFQGEDDFARVYFLDRSMDPIRDLREEWRRVSHGLFETAGMRVLAGRTLTEDDFRGTPRSAVVNEAFARKHYPAGNALGSRVSTHETAYRELEIVGVVADVRTNGPAGPVPPVLYVPLQGAPRGTTGMYVRAASGSAAALAAPVQEAIWSVDPTQPIAGVQPVTELVGAWVAIPRAVRSLVSGLAFFALLLAGVGVFGVVAYAVRRRRGEMGVRLALGASPVRLRREVLGDTVPLIVVGVVLGAAAGLAAAAAARTLLFGVEPADPVSLLGAVAVMAAAAVLATWLPASRASRIDPSEALRTE